MRSFAYSHPIFAAKDKKPTFGGDKKVGQSVNNQKSNEETLRYASLQFVARQVLNNMLTRTIKNWCVCNSSQRHE